MMKMLRTTMEPSSYIILFEESIYVKLNNRPALFRDLNLQKYHLLKSLAHRLVYYSIKHNKRYEKNADLCETARPEAEYEEFFKLTIEELMELATREYLDELHRVVQLFRENEEWPEELLCLVCGPASPRFGHPAMQYFARLTNKPLEQRATSFACQGRNISFQPSDQKYPARKLFYIENAHSSCEALEIGTTLLVEQTVMSQFADMSIDILAPNAMKHLQNVCGK